MILVNVARKFKNVASVFYMHTITELQNMSLRYILHMTIKFALICNHQNRLHLLGDIYIKRRIMDKNHPIPGGLCDTSLSDFKRIF